MPLYGDAKREYDRKWMSARRAQYFDGKNCVVCGSIDNLELDHIDPTTKVSHKIWSWSKARRDIELAKCQVLCHTHHKLKSIEQLPITNNVVPYLHGTFSMYTYHKCRCEDCKSWLRWHWRMVRMINKELRTNNPEMTSKSAIYYSPLV